MKVFRDLIGLVDEEEADLDNDPESNAEYFKGAWGVSEIIPTAN